MEKIKRLVFLSAFVVALVMFTSCGQKHKDYIPADSKIVGKIDIKAFFEQTGADADKLMEDIEDAFGDEKGFDISAVKEMGIDVKVPIYIFGRGKGANYSFGIVAKVDDEDKVKDWFENNVKVDIDKEGDGFEYFAEGNSAIGINKDALVIIGTTGTDAKKEIKKIMGKEIDGDLGDNKLFDKVTDVNSFACLYADLSIISEDVAQMLERQMPQLKENLEEIRKTTVGLDGNCSDGICDFAYWVESDDEKVQKKIDDAKDHLREIDEKGINTIPEGALGGLAANIDGAKLSKTIKKSLEDAKLLDEIPSEYKDLLNTLLGVISDIDGNLAGYMVAPLDMMFAVESKGNTADKIAELINSIENQSNVPSYADYGSYADSVATLSYEPAQFEYPDTDDVDFDDYEDYDFDYDSGYGSSSMTIDRTTDGYCLSQGYGSKYWFGNKNGALYFTNNESLISSTFKKADKPVPSEFVSFATSRRFIYFLNLGKVRDYTAAMDDDVKKAFNAFDEIVSKINYITFSMK